MRYSKTAPPYDSPRHGAEIALLAIILMVFALSVAIYNMQHNMTQDICRENGIISCAHIVVQEQALTPAPAKGL